MKFTTEFRGVPNGLIYPVSFAPGDECPPELRDAAISLGAVAAPAAPEVKPKEKKAK